MLFLIEQKGMRNKVPIHFSYVGTKLQISHLHAALQYQDFPYEFFIKLKEGTVQTVFSSIRFTCRKTWHVNLKVTV